MTTNPVVAVHAIVVFGLDLVVVEEILVVLGAVGKLPVVSNHETHF
jgi:hypothetical protein